MKRLNSDINFIFPLILLAFMAFGTLPAHSQQMKKEKYKRIKKKEKKRNKKTDKAFEVKSRWKDNSSNAVRNTNPEPTHEAAPVVKNPYNNPPKPKKNFKGKTLRGQRDPASLRSRKRGKIELYGEIYNEAPAPKKHVKANRYKRYLQLRRENAPFNGEHNFNIQVKKYGPRNEARYNRKFKGGKAPLRKHQPYWENATLRHRYGGLKGYFLGSTKRKKNPEKELEKKSNELSAYKGRHKTFTKEGKEKFYKKRSKAFADFENSYKERKKNDDMHPSAAYLNAKHKKSRKAKERSQKWWKRWFKWRKNADQPKHLKEKPKKPKYDTKESEIWYD